ncbi:hypothetical protein [Streptomyces liangshanensis]|uniref:LPXTG cell wall anchor domain-containing protein n=1 Tax=Streptomyces liangshanensis TaxID=2717324 RepID=A0A6G9H207_9ACTN|nr:hypothetical protein [Streptomyces liangshanensis]QIQ04572.1 hypothetical protein HA039_21815 [Streptomyces liangshanensis]
MTKKTRIRVARIAAGAVIAAGASLTVAGVAQATSSSTTVDIGLGIDDAPTDPVTEIPDPPTTPPVDPPSTPPVDPPSTPPVDPPSTPPVDPPSTPPVDPPSTPPVDPPTDKPTDKPTDDPTSKPTEAGGSGTSGGTGNGGTGTDGGAGANGGTGGSTGGGADTDSLGSQPVQQGEAKEELAETGAFETTFLVIGAATMIAGGIGFRMLPRLVGGGRAAV